MMDDPALSPPGIGDVPWHTLRHAYGSAVDVPDLLVTAYGADPDAAREAIGDLDSAVYHQGGGICSAAPAVLPFLVGLAADAGRGREVRRDALLLVFELFMTAVDCEPRAVHPDWPAARSARVPALEGLLDDPDPLIRRESADVLAFAVDDMGRVLTALHARWRLEDDPLTRLTLLSAAGDLLDRYPHGEAIHDAVDAGRTWEGAPVPAVCWLIDRERNGDEDERVVLLATEVLAPPPPEDIYLAFEAVAGLAREEAPLWAAARLHEPATRERVAGFAPSWLLSRFEADPDARGELAERMLGADTVYLRRAGLNGIADLVAESRSAEARWAPVLAGLLDAPDEDVRSLAALVLAVCGPEAAGPWADRLASLAQDPPAGDTNHALLALARLGDPRIVGLLRRRSHLTGFGLPIARVHAGGWTPGPALVDLLRPLAAFADDLVPVLRERLRSTGNEDERHSVTDALADWGAAAAPLLPEITGELEGSRYPSVALTALAAIGPAAAPACADRFLAWARGEPAPGLIKRWEALLAYWRVTGDADTVLELIDADSDTPIRDRMVLLGELGPLAGRYADAVREHVRRDEYGPRAHHLGVLWKVAGEREREREAALRCLLDGFERVWDGRDAWEGPLVVALVGEMAAREALPGLRALLRRDRRVRDGRDAGWRSMMADHRFTGAVRTAVERIESGAERE